MRENKRGGREDRLEPARIEIAFDIVLHETDSSLPVPIPPEHPQKSAGGCARKNEISPMVATLEKGNCTVDKQTPLTDTLIRI